MQHTNGDTRRHGMTVARGGVVVAKRLDVESLPLPAVSYEIRSEREERTEVTLVEQLPPTVAADRVGYHPEYGGDGWTCYDGGELVWRGELGPEESRRVVLAVWLDEPDTALSLLTPPTLQSVRTVSRDADPRVLDETLLARTGGVTGASAVAEHVPPAALRSDGVELPTVADLPSPGDGLSAPPRAAVDEAADAIVGGGSDRAHDRYYHLRVAVESAGRGEREVSVLEDLTNALSVLHADAEDRDGGDWRVLDVAIGTNWQAERIVTALGDDRRVSGLVVTELTGAVAARAAADEAPGADPNPDEFAASVFEAATAPEPTAEPDATGRDRPDGQPPSTGSDDTFDFDAEPDAGSAFGFDDEGTAADGEFAFAAGADGDDPDTPSSGTDDTDATAEATATSDAMETFAALSAETEQADVAALDAELEDVVLSPTGSEEYSIAELLEDVEEDAEPTSV